MDLRSPLFQLHQFVQVPLMTYVAACRFYNKPVNEVHMNRILFVGFLCMMMADQMTPLLTTSEFDLD